MIINACNKYSPPLSKIITKKYNSFLFLILDIRFFNSLISFSLFSEANSKRANLLLSELEFDCEFPIFYLIRKEKNKFFIIKIKKYKLFFLKLNESFY